MRPAAVPATRQAQVAADRARDVPPGSRIVHLWVCGDRGDRGDRGDIVTGWLVRIVLTCSILALVLFDAVSIGVAKMSVTDTADNAARAASSSWNTMHNQQIAFNAAWGDATDVDDTIDPRSFRVDPDGTVHLTVSRTASTLVVRLIGPIRGWADVQSDGSGRVDP